MHSHFPKVLVFNNMLLLLYKDNETTAWVGRPLWMLPLMGMTLWARSNRPQQTALVTKEDAFAKLAGTKAHIFNFLPLPM